MFLNVVLNKESKLPIIITIKNKKLITIYSKQLKYILSATMKIVYVILRTDLSEQKILEKTY